MSWHPKRIRTIAAIYVNSTDLATFGFTTQEFSMVGGYTENPKKPQTVKIGGWALAWDNTV